MLAKIVDGAYFVDGVKALGEVVPASPDKPAARFDLDGERLRVRCLNPAGTVSLDTNPTSGDPYDIGDVSWWDAVGRASITVAGPLTVRSGDGTDPWGDDKEIDLLPGEHVLVVYARREGWDQTEGPGPVEDQIFTVFETVPDDEDSDGWDHELRDEATESPLADTWGWGDLERGETRPDWENVPVPGGERDPFDPAGVVDDDTVAGEVTYELIVPEGFTWGTQEDWAKPEAEDEDDDLGSDPGDTSITDEPEPPKGPGGPYLLYAEYACYVLVGDNDEFEGDYSFGDGGMAALDGHLVVVSTLNTDWGQVLIKAAVFDSDPGTDPGTWDRRTDVTFTCPEPIFIRTLVDRHIAVEELVPPGTWHIRLHARQTGTWARPADVDGDVEEHLLQFWPAAT